MYEMWLACIGSPNFPLAKIARGSVSSLAEAEPFQQTDGLAGCAEHVPNRVAADCHGSEYKLNRLHRPGARGMVTSQTV